MTRHLLPPTYTRAAADVAEMTRTQLARDGVRVTRGAFVSRSIPLATAHATRAALAVLPEGTVASHATAAVLLGRRCGRRGRSSSRCGRAGTGRAGNASASTSTT